jgi:hypothetical protein|tara:strand:- start:338 stop:541 length:204 start_codon:yes stop_codon:yes gene_type:complete
MKKKDVYLKNVCFILAVMLGIASVLSFMGDFSAREVQMKTRIMTGVWWLFQSTACLGFYFNIINKNK